MMMRISTLGVALFLAFLPLSLRADEAKLKANRVSGVAPLAVMFDARGTTDSDVSDPFHDLLYIFEFGEKRANSSYAATWGLDGDDFLSKLSKDRYTGGPLAGHVYETPGTYRATVRARDPKGNETTAQVTITVQDPKDVFSGNKTICISSSGSFIGCPAGAIQTRTSSFGEALAAAETGKRVMLRRGDSFNGGGSFSPATSAIVGAFGAGARPVINLGNDGVSFGGKTPIMMDLEFRSTVTSFNGSGGGSSPPRVLDNRKPQNALLLRLKTVNGYGALGLVNDKDRPSVAVVDCEFGNVAARTDREGPKVIDGHPLGSMLMGNIIGGAPTGHNVRFFSFAESIFVFNKFVGEHAGNKNNMRIHALRTGEAPAEDFIVGYNTAAPGAGGQFFQTDTGSSNRYAIVRNFIIESNFIPHGQSSMRITGSNTSIRNNIKRGDRLVIIEDIGVFDPSKPCDGQFCSAFPSRMHRAYNNTCYFPSGNGPCVIVSDRLAPKPPLMAMNNLLYAPTAGTGDATEGDFSIESNNMFAGKGDPVPLAASAPARILDFVRKPALVSANIGAPGIDPEMFAGGGGGGSGGNQRPQPPVLLDVK